jgi:polyhydroxybutyrate depolymerase
MKKYSLILLLQIIFLNVSFGQDATSPGLHTSIMRYGGLDRKYIYYIPTGYKANTKKPLVFFLHGWGASAQIAVNVVGPQYNARADRDNAIAIYPEASSKHWNDMLGGTYVQTDLVDDVGYISGLIDIFIKDFKGDPTRVYISGSSNGGMMTYRLSCNIPDKIAAVAPFVSAISPNVAQQFTKAPPIPIVITSGTADPTIKWEGGPVIVTHTPELLSAEANVQYWKTRNGVSNTAEVTNLPDLDPNDKSTVIKYRYPGKYDVVLYKVVGGMHQHPTIRVGTKSLATGQNGDYNSFETVWDFMTAYTK